MSQIDPVFAAVTAAGTPFELADHDGMLTLFTTPMSSAGGFTFVRLADVNDDGMYFVNEQDDIS